MLEKPLTVFRESVANLLKYCQENGIKNLVTGSSGGLDSAIVLNIAGCAAQQSNGEISSYGVCLPIESPIDSVRLGTLAIRQASCIELSDPELEIVFLEMSEAVSINCANTKRLKVAFGNLKARIRMMYLYHLANTFESGPGMVMSTDNLSEYLMGFWTLHGDVGDYGPIQGLWKGYELYDLARAIGVPQEIIDAKPDDGLGVTSGGDEEQLGASYTTIDHIMNTLLCCDFQPNGSLRQLENLPEVSGVDPEIVKHIAKRCLMTAYKRKVPINISRKQLGLPEYEQLS